MKIIGDALETHLILLPVRIRIHCGIEQFCFSFFAKTRLMRNDLWAACNEIHKNIRYFHV